MCEDTAGETDLSSVDPDRDSPDQQREKELANTYTIQLFETYDEDILREILGDRYEERRQEYEALVATRDER